MSFSPIDSEYITMNYLLFRAGRQSKQWVHVVISLFDYDGKIIQIGESTQFELKNEIYLMLGMYLSDSKCLMTK